jgi:LacI family transcriptional regulator
VSATLADIAKDTNTSISTVSRVLTGAPASARISPSTRQKVMDAAQRLGYRPNLLARSLRTRKTHTLALIVSDIANPWFGMMASAMEQALHQRGYSLVVCNSCEDAELEQEYLRMLPQKGIDGLIVVPLATTCEQLQRHLPTELPVVVVDRLVEGMEYSIISDQQGGAVSLCEELSRIKVRKVAVISGPHEVFTHRLRAQTFRGHFEVVAEHEGPAQLETGRAGWEAIGNRPVEAVMCTNNLLGQGALEAMTRAGKQLPIACFDGPAMMDLLPTPIVSCVQDVERLANGAVELALGQLQEKQMDGRLVMPTRVVWNEAFGRLRGK